MGRQREGLLHADNPHCERCAAIVAFVASSLAENGYSPTFREIQRGCALANPSMAAYHLAYLVEMDRLCVGLGPRGEWLPRTLRPAAVAS